MTKVGRKERPSPKDRCKFIRVVVDEMRLVDLNPTRASCRVVANMIFEKYN